MADGRARIAAAFAAAADEGRAALMPYMMGGFPDHATAGVVAAAYAASGADLIELGVPYSDPLADGPVIHAAATRALQAGADLGSVLETCAAVPQLPVVAMAYANMVLARGPERFADDLREAGACGVIVPDLPLEEQDEIGGPLHERGLALVPLLAPTTPPERRRRICERAEGFVYAVSLAGVTGERSRLPAELAETVAVAREAAAVPVAVGFGVSTPEQAAKVGAIADGVIIGSRLVRIVSEVPDAGAAAREITEFLGRVRVALAG